MLIPEDFSIPTEDAILPISPSRILDFFNLRLEQQFEIIVVFFPRRLDLCFSLRSTFLNFHGLGCLLILFCHILQFCLLPPDFLVQFSMAPLSASTFSSFFSVAQAMLKFQDFLLCKLDLNSPHLRTLCFRISPARDSFTIV